MGPHPSGLSHPGLALGGGSGLLALSGALGAQLAAKDERAHLEAVAAAAAAEHHRGTTNKIILKLRTVHELEIPISIDQSDFSVWVENQPIVHVSLTIDRTGGYKLKYCSPTIEQLLSINLM